MSNTFDFFAEKLVHKKWKNLKDAHLCAAREGRIYTYAKEMAFLDDGEERIAAEKKRALEMSGVDGVLDEDEIFLLSLVPAFKKVT